MPRITSVKNKVKLSKTIDHNILFPNKMNTQSLNRIPEPVRGQVSGVLEAFRREVADRAKYPLLSHAVKLGFNDLQLYYLINSLIKSVDNPPAILYREYLIAAERVHNDKKVGIRSIILEGDRWLMPPASNSPDLYEFDVVAGLNHYLEMYSPETRDEILGCFKGAGFIYPRSMLNYPEESIAELPSPFGSWKLIFNNNRGHWCCVSYDMVYNEMIYYDPFGSPATKGFEFELERWRMRHGRLAKDTKLHINPRRDQSDGFNCGIYAILFVLGFAVPYDMRDYANWFRTVVFLPEKSEDIYGRFLQLCAEVEN